MFYLGTGEDYEISYDGEKWLLIVLEDIQVNTDGKVAIKYYDCSENKTHTELVSNITIRTIY